MIIDKTLLAENQEHRYRFTMGHEANHEFLHKEYFAYDPDQMTIFDYIGEVPIPMVQCRIDTKKMDARNAEIWTERDWMEWQANALSSAILMPVSMVRKVAESVKTTKAVFRNYITAAKVSNVFNVSFEAASYRLKQLGYISQDVQMSSDVLNMIATQLSV